MYQIDPKRLNFMILGSDSQKLGSIVIEMQK